MIINPTAFTGWNRVYHGTINHVAMAGATGEQYFRVSADGEVFQPSGWTGDLALAHRTTGDGAFSARKGVKIGSRYFVVGLLSDGTTSRSAIFSSTDLIQWDHIVTSIDGDVGSPGTKVFVDIAGNSTYIVALTATGERAVSTDGGVTFTGYSNIGFTGASPANSIAASSTGFVAVGDNGQIFTATDPRSTWTSRTNPWGSTYDLNRVVAGNVFCAVGNSGKIVTSPLNSLTTWTARASGTTETLSFLAYGSGRWFAGTGTLTAWLTSTDATTWSAPAAQPADFYTVDSGYHDGTQWFIHWHVSGEFPGHISVGDGTTWTEIENCGLGPWTYPVSFAA